MTTIERMPASLLAALLLAAGAGCGSTEPEVPAAGITAKIDGVAWSATTVAATLTGGVLAVTGSSTDGRSLLFGIGPVTGPGSFAVGVNLPSNAQFLAPAAGGAGSGNVWIASQHLGAGSFTVTSLTATGAAGTFELSLSPVTTSGATGTKTVTEGRFDVKF